MTILAFTPTVPAAKMTEVEIFLSALEKAAENILRRKGMEKVRIVCEHDLRGQFPRTSFTLRQVSETEPRLRIRTKVDESV